MKRQKKRNYKHQPFHMTPSAHRPPPARSFRLLPHQQSVLDDLVKRFRPYKKDEEDLEQIIVDEIMKMLSSINTRVSSSFPVSDHHACVKISSTWDHKTATVDIDFETGTMLIAKRNGLSSHSFVGERIDGRKVMLHDEECFEKMQAIVSFLLS